MQLPDTVTRAVLIGVDLGPNLSVTGSLATMLWLAALRREAQAIGAFRFLRLGLVVMPPALWIQGQPDIVHDYRDPEGPVAEHEPQRFVNNYRKAGGEIDLLYVDNAKKSGPGSFAPAAAFFHRHIPV